MHTTNEAVREKPLALSLLASERPRNVGWKQAAGLLFGDWGTSRLYVLGIALLFAGDSPGLWAIMAIAALGMFNLMGPKHTGGFAIVAAVGMIFITLLITAFALPKVPWAQFVHRVPTLRETLTNHPAHLWVAFV